MPRITIGVNNKKYYHEIKKYKYAAEDNSLKSFGTLNIADSHELFPKKNIKFSIGKENLTLNLLLDTFFRYINVKNFLRIHF